MQMRKKVGKLRNTVFFQWFVAPEGRKVGLLKRRLRSHLARWEMKNCTPLWREAHLQVKKLKTPHVRTTFGSWDVEKVHAVVARSTFASEKAKNTSRSDHFWKLRCRKSARRCGAKHMWSQVKVEAKNTLWCEAYFVRTTFGSWDVEKVHAVVARSTFRSRKVESTPAPDHFWKLGCRKSGRRCGAKHISKSKCTKHHHVRTTFGRSDVRLAWQAQGIVDLVKSEQNVRVFVAFPKTMAGVGHLNRICKDAFSVAGAVQETSSSELLGGPGVDFLRGVAFWSIRSSGLLRWFCVTGCSPSYGLASLFPGRRSSLAGGLEKSQNTLARCRQCACNFPFLKEVSQNCFVFDVVKFEKWRSQLLRFWCCQLKIEEVSQKCFVFDVVNFEKWRRLAVFDVVKLKTWGRLAE